MLPFSVLKTAQKQPILVELKNGETYNGTLHACDTWMNLHLTEVICTSQDGERFWRMKEVFIRGNTVKYIRVPDDTLGKVVEEKPDRFDRRAQGRGGRGRGPGRGRGEGRGGGRGEGRGGRGEGRGGGRGEGRGGGRGEGRGRGRG